jgi:hypothetical protein
MRTGDPQSRRRSAASGVTHRDELCRWQNNLPILNLCRPSMPGWPLRGDLKIGSPIRGVGGLHSYGCYRERIPTGFWSARAQRPRFERATGVSPAVPDCRGSRGQAACSTVLGQQGGPGQPDPACPCGALSAVSVARDRGVARGGVDSSNSAQRSHRMPLTEQGVSPGPWNPGDTRNDGRAALGALDPGIRK